MSSPVDRRAFLRHASLATLSASPALRALAGGAGRLTSRTAPQRVVVIGAGMAGLATATELLALGHDITLLEARTRPGGRVLTLREPFADGLYVEAGAMQVFDVHARVQQYIQRLGLEIDPISAPARPVGSVMHILGHRIETKPGASVAWPFEMSAEERTLDVAGLNRRYVTPLLQAMNEAEARGELMAAFGEYDRMTFTEYLRGRGASRGAAAIIRAGLASGLGDGADNVSALNLLREAAHRSIRRQSFTIRGGTDRLPRALAARLSDRIHYGTPVTRIEHDSHGVRAFAMQGSTSRVFGADHLVCTIPFSLLRRVDVSPPFDRDKRSAIEQLRYTSVTRVFVQTRTRFWVTDGVGGNATTDLPVMGVYERSINQPGARGLLESYQAGQRGRQSCALSTDARLRLAIAEMAKVYPRIAEQFEGGTSKCWDEDEWSRGAYAWFRPGEMSTILPHVSRSVGRIHFAGDHASSSPGWMEGALESAERVTREIDDAARGVQQRG